MPPPFTYAPTPSPTSEPDASFYPLTAPGIAAAVCGFILTSVTYCYIEDRRARRQLWVMKGITLYDVLLVGFYAAQSYVFLTFLTNSGSITGFGVTNSDDVKLWLRIHAYSRFLHIVDTIYPLYRSNRGQITYALLWHNALILPLWGFILDNEVLYSQGYVVCIAMLMCVMYCVVYSYLALSAWQICITPGAHIVTSFEVTVYCILFIHSCVTFYIGTQKPSDVQMMSSVFWCVYAAGMMGFVMKLMWKKRPLKCWPSLQMRGHQTVGNVGVPSG